MKTHKLQIYFLLFKAISLFFTCILFWTTFASSKFIYSWTWSEYLTWWTKTITFSNSWSIEAITEYYPYFKFIWKYSTWIVNNIVNNTSLFNDIGDYYTSGSLFTSETYWSFYIKNWSPISFSSSWTWSDCWWTLKQYNYSTWSLFSPLFWNVLLSSNSYICWWMESFKFYLVSDSSIYSTNTSWYIDINWFPDLVITSNSISSEDIKDIVVDYWSWKTAELLKVSSVDWIDISWKVYSNTVWNLYAASWATLKYLVQTWSTIKIDKTDFNALINKNIINLIKSVKAITGATNIDNFKSKTQSEPNNLFTSIWNNESLALFDYEKQTESNWWTNSWIILKIQTNNVWTASGGTYNSISITWKNTLIVKWWNVYINADIYNTNDKTSLLTIIVKRDSTNKLNWWNIYIDPRVTNIDAVLIAEWSILNYDWIWKKVLNRDNASENLSRQLLIYWTVATKNNVWDNNIAPIYWSDLYNTNKTTTDTNYTYNLSRLRLFRVNYMDLIEKPTDCSNDWLWALKWNTDNLELLKYAFAWKRKCWTESVPTGQLRTTNKISPVVLEYNPILLIDPPMILQK